MTGGLAPVGKSAEEVYQATYKKVIQRNEAYYSKYPEDVEKVHRIVGYIDSSGGVDLPSGGKLTAERLLTLGFGLGMHGGLDAVHGLILKLATDLDQFSFLTRSSLAAVEQNVTFDSNPIYAILHEAIYCCEPGVASNWAAYRVGKELDKYLWLRGERQVSTTKGDRAPLYFSGEMIFPFHFDTYLALSVLKEAAHILARYDGWETLYDEEQLHRNTVPVYAASFVEDMYVDFDLARETAKMVKGIQVFETNVMYHNAVRSKMEEVLQQLFKLRDDTID
jgi:hypothetical protein